jgi:hypothetical protein
MSLERAKYEYPIDIVEDRHKADAPVGIYLLKGDWHLAAHDSLAECLLLDAGALWVATLTFKSPALPTDVTPLPTFSLLQLLQISVS